MADQIYELRVRGFAARDFAECVFHYHCDADLANDFALAGELVGLLDDGVNPNVWLTRFLNCCSDNFNLTTLAARRISNGGGNTYQHRFPSDGLAGNVASPFHANQGSGCVIWIGSDEPENTGRNFIPGVPESFLENARWNSTAYTAYNAFIAFHLAGFTGSAADWSPVIYTRVGSTWQDMEHGYLSPKVGTQRRRERPV